MMIEKFDLTRLICMGGNINSYDLKESDRLKWLVNSDLKNLDYRFEQARFFSKLDDDIHTIIAYCKIIQFFDNNITAYEELAQYVYLASYYDWAIATSVEGLRYDYNNKKLQEILNLCCKKLID